MPKEIYRHYYNNKRDKHKFSYKDFESIQNYTRPWNKPAGGLWATKESAKYTWKNYCDDNGLVRCDGGYFDFTLKEDSNILYLRDLSDIDKIVNDKSMYLLKCMDSLRLMHYFNEYKHDTINNISSITMMPMLVLNFEYLVSDGVDAIDVEIEKLKYILYGWDCDSTLIMNPNIIVLS